MSYIQENEKGIILAVRAQPNAKKSALVGIWNETHLKIALKAPAVDGKANEALIAFIADFCDIPKRSVSFLSGDTAREKRLLLTSGDINTIKEKITLALTQNKA